MIVVHVSVQILVLGFCDSQRDLEVVQKILSQVTAHLTSVTFQSNQAYECCTLRTYPSTCSSIFGGD